MLIRTFCCVFVYLVTFSAVSQGSYVANLNIAWSEIMPVDVNLDDNHNEFIDGVITVKGMQSLTVFINKNQWLQINKLNDFPFPRLRYQTSITNGVAYQTQPEQLSESVDIFSPETKNRVVTFYNDSFKDIQLSIFTGSEINNLSVLDSQYIPGENLPDDTLVKQPFNDSLRFNRISSKKANEYILKGPALFKVTSLVESNSTNTKKVSWHIKAELNDENIPNWTHIANITRQLYYSVDDSPLWTSAPQSYYINIPEGKHKLKLTSSSKAWLQIVKVSNNFLLSSNSDYLIKDKSAAIEKLLSDQKKDQSAIKILNNPLWLEDPKSTLDSLTTLLGPNESSLAIKSYSDLFFKALTPQGNHGVNIIKRNTYANFWVSNAFEENNNQKVQFISLSEIQSGKVNNISNTFYKLTSQKEITFELPLSRLLSDIKVKIYNPHNLTQPLQIKGSDFDITAYLQPFQKNKWSMVSNLATTLPQLRESETKSDDLFLPPPIKGVHSEMVLSAGKNNRLVTISSSSDEPLYISLSHIAPKETSNSQQQWLSIFKQKNKLSLKSPATKNDNIDMNRFYQLIEKRAQQFTHGLNCELMSDKISSKNHYEDWMLKAGELKRNGLTEELAKLLYNSQIDTNTIKLWEMRLELLKDNGLWASYSQLLKGLSCNAPTPEIQHYAQRAYAELKLKNNEYMAYEQLLAYQINQQNTLPDIIEKSTYDFALMLFHQGKYRSSLASLGSVKLSDKNVQLSLWIAKELNYWDLYQHQLTFLDPKNVDFYLGLRDFSHAKHKNAMDYWQLQKINKKLSVKFIRKHLQQKFPAVYLPNVTALSAITHLSSKSVKTAYNDALPSGFTLLESTKEKPLQATIIGPVILQVTTRQLKKPNQNLDDDWVMITLNDKIQYIPLNANLYTSGLKIKDSELRLGKQYVNEFSLPEGEHHVTITPHTYDLLINMSTIRSNFPDLGQLSHSRSCKPAVYWQLIDDSGSFVDSCQLTSNKDKKESILPLTDLTIKVDEKLNTLSNKIYLWENSGKNNDHLLAEINATLLTKKNNSSYSSLISRLAKNTHWLLLQPTLSAGNKLLKGKPLTFQSPKAMISAISKSYDDTIDRGKLFKSFETLYFDLKIAKNDKIKLRIRNYVSPYNTLPDNQINIDVNNRPLPQKRLKQGSLTDIALNLKSGKNQIAVGLSNAYEQQLFTAEILVKSTGKAWRSINTVANRKVHLTSKNSPLSFFLSTPSLLRIDHFNRNNQVSSRFHYQDKPGVFSIKGNSQNYHLGYRVYQLNQPNTNKVTGLFYQNPLAAEIPPVSKLYILEETSSPIVASNATNTPAPSTDTWGGYYEWRKRINFDEGISAQFERFNEVGFQQRHYNESQERFWRFDALARVHESDHKVFGLKNYLDWRIADKNQLIHSQVSAFYQLAEGNQEAIWSARINVGWQRNDDLFDNVDNQLDVSIFGQRVEDLPINRQYWDNDVYSAYKQEHKNGAKISNRFRYTPYEDAELTALIDATSNPISQGVSIDSASILLSGKLYWRGLTVASSYQKKFFLVDDNRLVNYNRERWSLAVQHRFWQKKGYLWRLYSGLSYDVASQETSFNLGVSWNSTQNRGVTDFRLKEVPFRDLYQQQAKNSISSNEVVAK